MFPKQDNQSSPREHFREANLSGLSAGRQPRKEPAGEGAALTSGGCIQGTAAARGSPADDEHIELPAALQRCQLLLSRGEMLPPHWGTFLSLNLPQGTLQRDNTARGALAFCTHTCGGQTPVPGDMKGRGRESSEVSRNALLSFLLF